MSHRPGSVRYAMPLPPKNNDCVEGLSREELSCLPQLTDAEAEAFGEYTVWHKRMPSRRYVMPVWRWYRRRKAEPRLLQVISAVRLAKLKKLIDKTWSWKTDDEVVRQRDATIKVIRLSR